MKVHGSSGVVVIASIRDMYSDLIGMVQMTLVPFTGEFKQMLIVTRTQKTATGHSMVGG